MDVVTGNGLIVVVIGNMYVLFVVIETRSMSSS